MGKIDNRVLISDPVAVHKHHKILLEYPILMKEWQAKFESYLPIQRPSYTSILDIVLSILANKYNMRKRSIESIVSRKRYRYAETTDEPGA